MAVVFKAGGIVFRSAMELQENSPSKWQKNPLLV